MVLTVRGLRFRRSFCSQTVQFLRRGFSTLLHSVIHCFTNMGTVSRTVSGQALYRYIMAVLVVIGKETTESLQFYC